MEVLLLFFWFFLYSVTLYYFTFLWPNAAVSVAGGDEGWENGGDFDKLGLDDRRCDAMQYSAVQCNERVKRGRYYPRPN